MDYQHLDVAEAAKKLREAFDALEDKRAILRNPALKTLFESIKTVPPEQRASFGQEVNRLKQDIEVWVSEASVSAEQLAPVDVTAPFDVNVDPKRQPGLLPSSTGSVHPIMAEMERVADIFLRMGFDVIESRQLDDDYHMFESLNFPPGHPARDDWDTFITEEGLIAPAHTSTMQNRVIQRFAHRLEEGGAISSVIMGRVFRNEDLDATHEHTFHQVEGVYVGKHITVGNLVATLKVFLNEYFGEELAVKIQPFYFPFTEPSFEMAVERPSSLKKGNTEADRWLELLGCGMIHPKVLSMAGIDPSEYTGFAWGFGLDRLVLLKYGIEDIRHFMGGKLDFLRQFT